MSLVGGTGRLAANMEASTEALRATVIALTGEVKGLADEAHTLRKRTVRQGNWLRAAVVLSVATLALAGVLGFGVKSNRDTNQRLEATIARLDKSVKGQCAFNALVLGSYRPDSRPAGPLRKEYEDGFTRMREIYDFVGCGPVLPPAAPR